MLEPLGGGFARLPTENLEQCLDAFRPSNGQLAEQVAGVPLAWLCVDGPDKIQLTRTHDYDAVLEKMARIPRNLGRISAGEKRQAEEMLKARAKELGDTCGKWMLFAGEEDVDEMWGAVAQCCARGELGCSAKVSVRPDESGRFLICVYVKDFTDEKDVRRVLFALRRLGFEVRSGFKPDCYTYLGIYTASKKELLQREFGYSEEVATLIAKMPTTIYKDMLKETKVD